ncbi:MAG: thioredoxin family protein [Phycisphaerae bacterium]|nr:thioredoxin family protein [Phycisphaerae bacterium]
MKFNLKVVLCAFLIAVFSIMTIRPVQAAESNSFQVISYTDETTGQTEYSNASIEPATYEGKRGIAVLFEGSDDLHFYANPKTAPGGYFLKIAAESKDLIFGEARFPESSIFHDKALDIEVEVFVGDFTVFIPLDQPFQLGYVNLSDVKAIVSGIACTSQICLTPFEKTIAAKVNTYQSFDWPQIELAKQQPGKTAESKVAGYSLWFALGLAFVAGLSLNIMPCVWPVLPIIIMRIVEQAAENKARSIYLGLLFCAGILLFFAALAGANIVLQLFYGTVLQWGDQMRNPVFLSAMAILLVAVALFMFGVFNIGLPSSVTGGVSGGKGVGGAVGMGFLAAILSTPCSFGILAAAFAWAQAQTLVLGTLAIIFIGIGMASPYAVLTSVPGLLKKLPRAGRWMELFKQTVGFILLVIAIKLIVALPDVRISGVLYFSVVLGFGLWMWGSWVGFGTPAVKKWFIRSIAVVLIVAGGWIFLSSPKTELIKWGKYDSAVIAAAREEKRPLLIKFTADWCFSCQVIDKTIFSRKDIASLIEGKQILVIKADTTESDFPATLALKNIYKEPGVPVTILYMPDGREIRWRGITFGKELKEHLEGIE